MRVLYVIDTLGEGGTERSLADLLPPLMEHGVEPRVCILTSRGSEGVETHLRASGIPVEVLRGHRFVSHVAQLRRQCRLHAAELVHSMLFASNLRARAVQAVGGPPLVNSLVNISYGPERLLNPSLSPRKLDAVRRVDRATARFVDRFHAVSEPVAAHAHDALGVSLDRIQVIERGRDQRLLGHRTPARRMAARAQLGLSSDDLVIANVARHEHQKGLDTLLRATATILDTTPVVVVQAGGRGAVTSQLQALHRSLELGERFRFLGHRQDVGDLLAAADLFAFPSRYEGMPGALIEAMALSLPIVASDVDTVSGVLEADGNALVVPVDDPQALAAACVSLLDDAASLRSMSVRSRAIYTERFTIDRSAAMTAQFYQEVVERRITRARPDLSRGHPTDHERHGGRP